MVILNSNLKINISNTKLSINNSLKCILKLGGKNLLTPRGAVHTIFIKWHELKYSKKTSLMDDLNFPSTD
jgi:hypothetical protein